MRRSIKKLFHNNPEPSAPQQRLSKSFHNNPEPSAPQQRLSKSFQNNPEPSAPRLVKNIVLVGRTGNGKSATGNSLIGREVFISEAAATSGTKTCQTFQTETPDGMLINVIDTPGLFDLSESALTISKEIIKCLTLAEEGLHVVVLVLSVRTRITQEEENTLSTLQVLFGKDILEYLIVLFTGGDELEGKITLDDYFGQGCPVFLKTVLSLCGGRTVVFNNKTTDKRQKVVQVQQFLAHVASIETRNHGEPFRGQMHCEIKEEKEKLRQQQRAVEARRNLGEAELANIKKELQTLYETRMSQMEQKVENTLRQNYEQAQRDYESLRDEQNQDQKKHMMIQAALAAPAVMGMIGCSIL